MSALEYSPFDACSPLAHPQDRSRSIGVLVDAQQRTREGKSFVSVQGVHACARRQDRALT